MKQALEALERYSGVDQRACDAEDALRTAIAEAEKQEAWKTSDTAYRPGGLPQDFIKHEVDAPSGWSEWVCPDPEQYFMKCCDCGLVHKMQFKVVKYSEGDECEDFDDPYVQAVFRARRTTPPAAQQKPDAYGYAERLAEAIWQKHYKSTAPQWKPLDDLLGVLTQIDNMTAGLTTPPAAQRQWVGLTDEAIWSEYQTLWPFHPAEEPRLAKDIARFARAIEAALKEKNNG